jgi:flagellar motor component MotA
MQATSFIAGMLFFVGGTLGCFLMAGGILRALWFPVPMLVMLLAPLGSAILAFGLKDVWSTVAGLRLFFAPPSSAQPALNSIAVTRYLIVAVYATAGLLFLFQLGLAMAQMGGAPEELGRHAYAALFSLTYPIFISEALLRPLKCRLENQPALVPATNSGR